MADTPEEGRAELLRALAAWCAAATPPTSPIAAALGLAPLSREDHTSVFLLTLPPYAPIHLGPPGKLGGQGTEAVAGFFRALELPVPAEPDHLATLLGLAAHLADAERTCRTDGARRRLHHARAALFGEHLACWIPGYLTAVEAHGAAAGWARLTRTVLAAERAALGGDAVGTTRLPRALLDAPAPLSVADGLPDLLDALVAPVRAGFILTREDLVAIARAAGAGLRHGERRFLLSSLLEQSPAKTLASLARHARAAADRHVAGAGLSGATTARWWTTRARHTAGVLEALAARTS